MSSLGSLVKMPVEKGPLELLVELGDSSGSDEDDNNDFEDPGTPQPQEERGEERGEQPLRQRDLMPRMSTQVSTLRYLPSIAETDTLAKASSHKSPSEIVALLVSSSTVDDGTPGLFDGLEEVRRSKASSISSTTTTAECSAADVFPSNDQLMDILHEGDEGDDGDPTECANALEDEDDLFAPREAFSKGAKGRISKAEAKFLMAGRLFGEEAQTMKPKVQHGQVGFKQLTHSHSATAIQEDLEAAMDPSSPRRPSAIRAALEDAEETTSRQSAACLSPSLGAGITPDFWLELWDQRAMQFYYSNVLTGETRQKKPRNLIQTTIALAGVTILCYAPASLKQVFAAMKIQRVWRNRRDRLEAQKKRRMLLKAAEKFDSQGGSGAAKRGSNTKSATDAVIDGLHEAFVECHLTGPVKEDCVEEDYREKYAYDLPNCSFKILAPEVFKNIREHFGISSEDFHSSMRDELKVMSQNAGRSGSWFFISGNKKYILKSITRTEDTLLRTILPSYVEYIHTFPHTLLTRYLGLFHLRVAGRKLRLVAMSNVFAFCMPAEAYDLKGSFVNRTVLQPGEKPTPGKIMKDNDLKREMRLDIIAQNMLIAQLQSDTDWLVSHDIMDYSLLLGVNQLAGSAGTTKRDTYSDQLSRFSVSAESLASPRISTVGSSDALDRRTSESSPRSSSGHATGASRPIPIPSRSVSMDPDAGRRSSLRSKLRFPLRQKKQPSMSIIKPTSGASDMLTIPPTEPGVNAFMLHEGGLLGENSVSGQDEVYYIGIIDMLQQYNVNKKMERGIKRATGKAAEGISSINSTDYAARFMRYMQSIFQ